jgi:hypothetical protein
MLFDDSGADRFKGGSDISLSEWQEALNSCQPNDTGYTVTELADMLNVPRRTMSDRIRKSVKDGNIKCGKAMRGNRSVDVYQLIKKD